MKRVLSYICCLCLLIAVGCDDSDSYKYEYERIDVMEGLESFAAKGGAGKIVLGTNAPVKISCDKTWCKVSLSQKVINVEVEPNISRSGRTALITLESEGITDYLPITQLPVLIDLYDREISFSAAGGTIQTKYDCDVPATVAGGGDWLTVEHVDNQIILTASEYIDIEKDRTKTVKITAEGDLITREITVVQRKKVMTYDSYLGKWKMSYTADRATDADVVRDVTIEEKKNGETYNLKGLDDLVIELKFSDKNLEMLAQIVLTDENQNVLWLCPRSTNSTNIGLTSGFISKVDTESDVLAINWADNGVWKPTTPPVTGFTFRYYNSAGSSTTNYYYFDTDGTRYRNILLPFRMEKVTD